jgi:transposase-like protein
VKQDTTKDQQVTTDASGHPNSEVDARPTRRRFTAEYKLRILRQLDASSHGEIGGLLRREGLYSSHIETWRGQRERGELEGLSPKKRGRKPLERNPLQGEVDKLRRENARLNARLKQAELINEAQKKLSQLLGIAFPAQVKDDET